MKPISRLCLLFLSGLAAIQQVSAQEALRIAAIVNDEVISAIDVGSRMDLTLLGMGQGASDDLVRRLAPQVMRLLIDEKLQMQEARARGIAVSDSDIEASVKDIESSNKMPPGSLSNMLAQNHVPISALHEQLRARLAWQRLIIRRVRSTYQISDDEVDEEIARLKTNAGKQEYLASDIFLAIDPNSDEQLIQSQASRLVEQIKGGANFAALARQFSQSSAANASGDLGWVRPGQLEAPLERALAALTPGAVSEPIRTQTGLHVLQLREKRAIAGPDFDKTLVKLSQILLPLDDKSTAAAVQSQIELARQIGDAVSNCADFNEMAQSVGTNNGDMGNVILKDLPVELRQAVAQAPVGKATAPIRTARGVSVLMVCARTDDDGGINRDTVRSQLLMVRADSESRRYLRDLRAAANIDVRQ